MGVLMAGTIRVAAQDTLMVQGSAPDLYLMHTVRKGETWYSLGRAYGLSPKEIAAKNKMQMDQGLALGKEITIPLGKNNFVQDGEGHVGNGFRPVYHQVLEKETLYRISVKYGKVPLDNVRHWNNFSGDGVKKDALLIVGYVKGTGQSTIPASTVIPPAPVQPPPTVTKQELPTLPKTDTPAPKSQPSEPEKKQTPPPPPPTETSVGRTPAIPEGGFEQLYMQQTANSKHVATEKGPGTWFRSNAVSGSGKYYALHNTAPRGTIVKVTNPLNGKFIYAKVLDAIPQLKANANLIIKLSDAAQEALGTREARFYCELSYDEK